MTITQLEYIVAVHTHQNFALAARNCGVTQPTLSMQIKKLEEDLGVIIFDRSKKPVISTDLGSQIIDHVKTTLMGLRQINDIIRENESEINGQLRIGIISTLSPYLLPLFILNFTSKYPNVEISIEELLSEQIMDKLKDDLLDVGILATPVNDSNLNEDPMFYEAFVIYVSTAHPLSHGNQINFSDLDLQDMWLLKEGHCFRNQAINICSETQPTNRSRVTFESGSLETLRNIVDQEYGYTLLPELAMLSLEDSKQSYIKHFNDPRPIREISLIIHRTSLKRKLIDALRAEILEAVPKNMRDKSRGRLVEWR